jgi:hypothetical protein
MTSHTCIGPVFPRSTKLRLSVGGYKPEWVSISGGYRVRDFSSNTSKKLVKCIGRFNWIICYNIVYFDFSNFAVVFFIKYCINTVSFSPLQVNNKPCERAMNVCLFLGLLAWLLTERS